MMMELKEKCLVDEAGKASAVVLDIKTYKRLLQHVEDLEDALELDQARQSAKSFRPYKDIRTELKKDRNHLAKCSEDILRRKAPLLQARPTKYRVPRSNLFERVL